MAQIYTVLSTDWGRAEHVNQLTRTLRNVLGLIDTTQDALGRLVLPRATAAPADPVEGRTYYDSATDIWWIHNGTAWMPQHRVYQSLVFQIDTTAVPIQGAGRMATILEGNITLARETATVWGMCTVWWFGIGQGGPGNVRDILWQIVCKKSGQAMRVVLGPMEMLYGVPTNYVSSNINFGSFFDSPGAGDATYELQMLAPVGFADPDASFGITWATVVANGVAPPVPPHMISQGGQAPCTNLILVEL